MATRLFAGWSSGDPDAPEPYFRPDGVLFDVASGRFEGWPAIRAFFARGLEKWDDLSDLLETHLEVRPDDDAARFAYAGVNLRLGRFDLARRHHDILRERRTDLPGLDDLSRLLEPERLAASAA